MACGGVTIRSLARRDLAGLAASFGPPPFNKPADKWPRLLSGHEGGERHTLVALLGEAVAGYASLLPRSRHGPFRAAGVPEIEDLNVGPAWRRRGIATRLIAALEAHARGEGHATVGIGVGLDGAYGPAQRLYVRLGYMPDGHGLSSGHAPVARGETVRVDDKLNLWFTKGVAGSE